MIELLKALNSLLSHSESASQPDSMLGMSLKSAINDSGKTLSSLKHSSLFTSFKDVFVFLHHDVKSSTHARNTVCSGDLMSCAIEAKKVSDV